MTFTEILKDQVPSFSRFWWYVPRQAHSNSSVVICKDGSDAHYIKQLKKWHFWATHVNRKWDDFPYAAKFVSRIACEQALLFGRAKRAARERPPQSRLLSRASRACTFHDIPQMESLLAGYIAKRLYS